MLLVGRFVRRTCHAKQGFCSTFLPRVHKRGQVIHNVANRIFFDIKQDGFEDKQGRNVSPQASSVLQDLNQGFCVVVITIATSTFVQIKGNKVGTVSFEIPVGIIVSLKLLIQTLFSFNNIGQIDFDELKTLVGVSISQGPCIIASTKQNNLNIK
jgi:hypothetical protein